MDSSLRKGQNLRAYRASTKLHTDGTRDSHTLGWGMPLTSSKAPTASHTKKKRAVHPTMESWRPNQLNQLMASGIFHEFTTFTTIFFCSLYHATPIIVVTPSNSPGRVHASDSHASLVEEHGTLFDGREQCGILMGSGAVGGPETLVDISGGIINLI